MNEIEIVSVLNAENAGVIVAQATGVDNNSHLIVFSPIQLGDTPIDLVFQLGKRNSLRIFYRGQEYRLAPGLYDRYLFDGYYISGSSLMKAYPINGGGGNQEPVIVVNPNALIDQRGVLGILAFIVTVVIVIIFALLTKIVKQ